MIEHLIVTVGSNPLPVALAILHLKPRAVHYVYTPEVEQGVVERVRTMFRQVDGADAPRQDELLRLRDHRRAHEILEDLDRLKDVCPDAALNYTGGTKRMAVQAHRFWREHGGQDRNASYLGADGTLYFDDRSIDPVAARDMPSLKLSELCRLHFGMEPHCGDEHRLPDRRDLARRIQGVVSSSGFDEHKRLLPPLYGSGKDRLPGTADPPIYGAWQAAGEKNFGPGRAFRSADLAELGTKLRVEATDLEGFHALLKLGGERAGSSERLSAAAQWLWSGWLEVWLADPLAGAKALDGRPLFDEVHQNVEIGTEPDRFEMDVVAVKGHRLFLFSCTVDGGQALVKSKAFEALHRTSRVGGEHARSAVVCLAPRPADVLATVREERWPGYDNLRLFGAPHVAGGQAPCDAKEGAPNVTLLQGLAQWVSP